MLDIEKQERFEPRLQPLASTIRHVLSQCAPKSLAALTLVAGLSAGSASAATIAVNASCTLINAITAANSDASTGGCPAGSGADTIVLPAKSIQTLTTVNNNYHSDNGLPVIRSAITISGNGSTIKRASAAPAFRIFEVAAPGNLTLNTTTVSGGVVDKIHGGGGLFIYSGQLTLNNSTVSGNSATGSGGGGVYNAFGTLTLNNSTVSGNLASSFAGGLMNIRGQVIINNSTLSGNVVYASAPGGGGGLENYYGTATLSNSTVSGNSLIGSGLGGGIYNHYGSSLSLSRSLVSGNTSSGANGVVNPGAEVYNNGTVSADNHNLFGHKGSARVSGFTPGASDIVPTQGLTAILASLANNGGATQTHLLVAGSPAINASPHDADCSKTDQRGIRRPQGSGCDIGAVEVVFCDIATPTTGCTVNGVPNQRCEGTDAADTIIGTGGNDIIRGLGGDDILKGYGGNDKLCGGVGNDRLEGGWGLDQLFGGFGADKLLGGDHDDSLFGEQDNDNLDGGLGADKLNGGPGFKDTCLSDGSDTSKIGCEL